MKQFYATSLKLFSILAVIVFLATPAFSQSTQHVYRETFSGNAFPAGWASIGYKGTKRYGKTVWEWKVVQGINSIEGDSFSSAMNLRNSENIDLTDINIWAFTPAITLAPGVYTTTFYHTNNAAESVSSTVVLNNIQDKNGATTIYTRVLESTATYVKHECTFLITKADSYYLGFGVNNLPQSVNTWIDDISIAPTKVFYNKTISDLSSLSSWSGNRDGSGPAPTNMTDADQVFYITNYTSGSYIKLSNDWALSGTNSKVVVGNGTTPVTLELTEKKSLTAGTLEATNNATVVLNTPIAPTFGQMAPQSTLVLGKNASDNLPSDVVFGTVILDSGKKNKLSKNAKIQGKLELKSSKLELGDFDLELGYNSTIENGSATNYIVVNGKGRLRKGIKAGTEALFPVGNATYNPIKIKQAAGATEDIFSVSIIDGVYNAYTNDVPDLTKPLQNKTVNKTWIVSEDVKGGSDITMTLTWNQTDALTGFDATRSHVKHYENGNWDVVTSASATLSGTTFSMSRSGINTFSPFTVSSDDTPVAQGTLPVELVNFTAKTAGNTVQLNWATATERDNDFFAVERSADGREFSTIASVKGVGTTSIRTNYSFTDTNPLAGTSYYRLRQVDTDGEVKYLPVIAVTRNQAQSLTLSLYPNPAQGGTVNLQVQGMAPGEAAQLKITDMVGKTVLQQRLQTAEATIATADVLKPGTYVVTVAGKAGLHTQKLIIR